MSILLGNQADQTIENMTNRFSDEPLDYASIYAHGKLEDYFGYDIMGILEGSEAVNDACTKCSVVPVKVDGVDEPCTMFAWNGPWCNTYRKIALVVLDSDKESMDDARAKYEQRKAYV